ncbi:MAG: virion core protein, T7 gp14 family [Pseudomonadaceae bacterium]
MFTPASFSLGMQAAGAVSGAIGSFYSAKSTKRQLQFEAAMADINARISELGARSALDQGQKEIASLTMQAGRLKSSQRAAMAANGVDLGEGNAAELQASTDIMKEIDKNTLEANAVKNAWGYRTQGANYQSEAMMKRGTAGGISPLMAGASSMLTGAGQVASSWYQFKRDGAI